MNQPEANHEMRSVILHRECYYLRAKWEAALREKLELEMQEMLSGPPSGDNAKLALTASIRKCLEDQAAEMLAWEVQDL